MATLFVSRHPGAIEWMKRQPIHVDQWLTHLTIDQVHPNDIVIGVLPFHMAFQVCERGARFFALEIDLPSEKRGVELDAHELTEMTCSLKEYVVLRR